MEPENPAWQNQGIFFWTAKEPFEKKSLPPEFKQLEKLRVLDLKGTRFLQKLPQVVAELPSLELVDLRNHPEWKADQFDNAIKLLPGIKVLVD